MLTDEQAIKELRKLPNIGPACARDLLLLGIRKTEDLKGKDPVELYDQLCTMTQSRQDPCVLDTLMSVVHFADTGEARKWFDFTAERKEKKLI